MAYPLLATEFDARAIYKASDLTLYFWIPMPDLLALWTTTAIQSRLQMHRGSDTL